MKDFIVLNMESIIAFITIIVTYIMGFLSKRFAIVENKYIPIQNFIIMILSVIVYFYATGNFSLVIASGSPVATLIYDIFNNLKKGE